VAERINVLFMKKTFGYKRNTLTADLPETLGSVVLVAQGTDGLI